MKPTNVDNVNHPSHYKSKTGLEVIDVICAFTEDMNGLEGYYTGNVLKYMCRWKKKNGLEDLKKARVYLNWLIDEMEKKQENQRTADILERKLYVGGANYPTPRPWGCCCKGLREELDKKGFCDTDSAPNNDIITMVVRDILKSTMNYMYGVNNNNENEEEKENE